MTKEDVVGIHSLLQANMGKFQLSPILSLQEVEHWLLPRENVIDTYVVEVSCRLSSLNFFAEGTAFITIL